VPVTVRGGRKPAPIYLGRAGKTIPDVYLTELGNAGHGSRFKWLISTCLAAIVGVCAIFFAIYGAMEERNGMSMLETITHATEDAYKPTRQRRITARVLRRVSPKSDRLQASASGVATKHIIHESVRQRRGEREFITIKPYARIVARLAVERPDKSDLIPAFSPFKLYANTRPAGNKDTGDSVTGERVSRDGVTVQILELVGGILPADDGLELSGREVAELVTQAGDELNNQYDTKSGNGVTNVVPSGAKTTAAFASASNTTVLEKTVFESDDISGAIAGQEIRIVKVRQGDNLVGLIRRAGAEDWQARAIDEQVKKALKSSQIEAGMELHMTLVPSPTRALAMEPLRISLYSTGHRHHVTVTRDDAGEYVASTKAHLAGIAQAVKARPTEQRATLYTSLYHAALSQKLQPGMILKILRFHAYDTDFSRGVRPGDGFEFFFDLQNNQKTIDARPSELLFTSLTAGGKTRRFYRYRTPDGAVDYYDTEGNNSKRFLMRKPVKSGNVRFTSGFGFRMHPILRRRKMHTGVDWAARRGTPILAAGNGSIVEAGRKGGNGNFIRIRHANGYQSTYSHMQRIAKGMAPGIKVSQGQVIGYVGSTGLSTGSHLHYEVLVNNRQVNPMSIHVPRGRQLKNKLLLDFQKKRARIDDLMGRAPVITRVAEAGNRG